jgi:reactive intermediate/imine deaminase
MTHKTIRTELAPQAIGTYSQAVRCGDSVYLSGQIPLVPHTMELVEGGMEAQIRRVFDNLSAVAVAAEGSLADVVKLNVYLVDLGHFALVNQVMAEVFSGALSGARRGGRGIAAPGRAGGDGCRHGARRRMIDLTEKSPQRREGRRVLLDDACACSKSFSDCFATAIVSCNP